MIKKMFAASIAIAILGTCLSASATEATSEGFPPAQNLNFYHVPGADQAVDGMTAPMGGTDYLFLAGSAFTPRNSSQTVTYPGGGCAYSDEALTTSLELPNSAVIEGVRLFYYSNSSTDNVTLFLTTYPGDGTANDLLIGASTASSGYADQYFPVGSPVSIDNLSGSYVLTASIEPNTRFCGMRVFYTP